MANKKNNKENDLFMGIRGVHFIWHGAWCDPELRYKKDVANYCDVEDSLWTYYTETCEEEGIKPDENEGFRNFCRKNSWVVKGDIQLFAAAARGEEI